MSWNKIFSRDEIPKFVIIEIFNNIEPIVLFIYHYNFVIVLYNELHFNID